MTPCPLTSHPKLYIKKTMFKYVYIQVGKIVLKVTLGGYKRKVRGHRDEMQHRKGCSKGAVSEQSVFVPCFCLSCLFLQPHKAVVAQSVSPLFGRLVSTMLLTPTFYFLLKSFTLAVSFR